MSKRVLLAGLIGGIGFVLWGFVVNGIFGFTARLDMQQLPDERTVYETLKANVVEPGRYIVNPALTEDRRFPEGEPVFSVLYGGVGHEAAGKEMILGLVYFLLASTIAAWLLSRASERVLGSYWRKALYFVAIGGIIAIFSDLPESGIGNYPARDVLLRATVNVVSWAVVGLAVSAVMRPASAR